MSEIPLLNVDWSLSTVFRKIGISGTSTYTFSNVTEGKTIVLVFIASSLTDATINLPAGTKTDNSFAKFVGDAQFITGGSNNVMRFASTTGMVVGDLVSSDNGATFPRTIASIVNGTDVTVTPAHGLLANTTVPAVIKPANYALPSGKGVAIEVSRFNGVTYARQIFRADLAKWPYGPQGNLTIENGQTVNVAAGSVLDYNDVWIKAGGTLNIQGGGTGAITLLGVKGNLTIDGVIKGNDGLFGSNTFNVLTPLGESVSYTVTQRAAGAGGAGRYPAGPGGSGGSLGYGGGGGGGGDSDQSRGWGGGGGTNNGPGNRGGYGVTGGEAANGIGGVTLGNGYSAGTGDGRPFNYGKNGGGSGGGGAKSAASYGGAGGGYKGKHGLGLYIYCLGTVSGAGQIQLNGLNGFNGGNGQASHSGGAGGAAGGSGGKLWVRARAPFTVPYTVSGGTGGTGGSGNIAGGPGQAGLAGTFDFLDNLSDIRT